MPIRIIEAVNKAGLGLQASFKFVATWFLPFSIQICVDLCLDSSAWIRAENPSMTTQVSVTARAGKPQNSLEKVS